jgi:ribose-phosphate pyrophosphokinase
MKINIRRQEGVKVMLYPDNQPHVILDPACEKADVDVVANLSCALDVVNMVSVSNALLHCNAFRRTLYIPYLLGARSDRVTKPMESVESEVVADMINLCGFNTVKVLDAHSSESVSYIRNYLPANNQFLVEKYNHPNAVFICPDKGAHAKCMHYFNWNPCLATMTRCKKERNPQTGELVLHVMGPEVCKDRNCVVIDDLCDGGRTFIEIAKQIQSKHLTLIVTHGLFTKGLSILKQYFNEIICSDSCNPVPNDNLTTIPWKI